MARTINWNAAKLKALKVAYAKATESRHHRTSEAFKVELPEEREPAEFTIGFAKHLIDHLEAVFAANPPRDFGPNLEGEEGQ